jgi:hypothetical protein
VPDTQAGQTDGDSDNDLTGAVVFIVIAGIALLLMSVAAIVYVVKLHSNKTPSTSAVPTPVAMRVPDGVEVVSTTAASGAAEDKI